MQRHVRSQRSSPLDVLPCDTARSTPPDDVVILPKWGVNRHGTVFTARLVNDLELIVRHQPSRSRNSALPPFIVFVFGFQVPERFDDVGTAKAAACEIARDLLRIALANLGP